MLGEFVFSSLKTSIPDTNAMCVQGIANLVGPVFAGWLYDFSKEWFLTFGLTGFFIGEVKPPVPHRSSLTLSRRYL
jgi:hypothetical protein